MKFYVLRDTTQGIGDTILNFKVRNETWEPYEGLDTTELEVYDTEGVETGDSPLQFVWDQVKERYVVGQEIDNLLDYILDKNYFQLPLTLQTSQGQNEIEQGVYRIKFYFEDIYGTVMELGDRYLDIQTTWGQQNNIPVGNVTKITTDVEPSNLEVGDEIVVTIVPRNMDVQSYASEIQIVMTPDDITTDQGVVRRIQSQNPIHEILVHGLEDMNDVKYEYDVDTETWTLTCIDQTDHETEIGEMTEIDTVYLIGHTQAQAIGQEDSEIVITTLERSDQANDYTVEVVEGTGDDQQLSVDLTDEQITVTLGTDPFTTQSATIGQEDSEIVIETIGTGLQMNDYTVEVVEGTGDDQQLSASLLGNQVTVTLGTDPNLPQTQAIGSGEDGTVNIETIDGGLQMNSYTVEVVEGTGDDQQLSASLLASQITVTLGTDPFTPQTANIGSGTDGTVEIETIGTGLTMNDYTVEVVEGTGNDQQLSASLLASQITVTLGTDPFTPQTATIGSGTDGAVEIETIGTGLQMNDYTVEVVQGVGNDVLLSAQLVSDQITVTLGTDGTGQLDPAKNTQTLIQQAIQQIDDGGQVFTQVASGTGNDPITQAEGPTQFTGGEEDIQSPTKNTQTLIQQAIQQIDDGGQVFTQVASGTGNDPITQAEGPTQFTGGEEDIQSPTKNTQDLIQQEIQQIEVDEQAVFTQVQQGTDPILTQEGPTQFTGGEEDIQSPTKNTQDLIQQEIQQIEVDEQAVFTQVQQGTDPILTQEGPTSFTGAEEDIQSSTKNTQDLIQQEIQQLEADEQTVFTQVQQGTDPILTQEGPTQFTGGIDFHPDLDEEECELLVGQVEQGFDIYATADYQNYVLIQLDENGKYILETLDPDLELSKTILETLEESGYAQAYNELAPILTQEAPVYAIPGNIMFEVIEQGLSDIVTYNTNNYTEELRQQISYIAKMNPGVFVITEDDPIVYPTLLYDNSTSDLTQTTIQQAIDELKQLIDELE